MNKEKALAVFTYCYEKKMQPWKIMMDADTGDGASEENFSKAARSSYNSFQITAKIKLYFDKNTELYNKR